MPYLSNDILHEESEANQTTNRCRSNIAFCLGIDCRCSKQRRKRIWNTLSLKGVKVDFLNISDDPEFEDEEYKLLIFTYAKNYLIYHCKSLPNYEKWQKYLKKSCILQNYGKYYVNKKVIGKGNFAKVILAERLTDNKKFAIKTFDKRKLMQQSIEKKTAIANEIHLMCSAPKRKTKLRRRKPHLLSNCYLRSDCQKGKFTRKRKYTINNTYIQKKL